MGGLSGSLARANSYGKKHCRILFWRMRAALKKAVDNGHGRKRRLRFQYDPSSYALNFDDGSHDHHQMGDNSSSSSRLVGFRQSNYTTTTCTWIYVIWVESSQIPR